MKLVDVMVFCFCYKSFLKLMHVLHGVAWPSQGPSSTRQAALLCPAVGGISWLGGCSRMLLCCAFQMRADITAVGAAQLCLRGWLGAGVGSAVE